VQRDEAALEAFGLEVRQVRCAGSKACASTPFARSA
jgi:hypothetical protein